MSVQTICTSCGNACPAFRVKSRGVCDECVAAGGCCKPIVPRTAIIDSPPPTVPSSQSARPIIRNAAIFDRYRFAVASASLSEEQREAVLYFFVAGQTMAKIAKDRRVSVSAISQRIAGALDQFHAAGLLKNAA